MKRGLAIGAGVLLVLAGGAVAYGLAMKPKQRPAPDLGKIGRDPDLLARGAYLYERVMSCDTCHAARDWTRWAGPRLSPRGAGAPCLEGDRVPGRICFPNITPDRQAGIGAWTDGEILRAVREGVGRDGEALFPMMPYESYAMLSDADGRALVAYLRSLPAVRNKVPRSRISFPLSVFIKTLPRPLPGPVPDPPPQDRGRYLVTLGGCVTCHTPVDGSHEPIAGMLLAGGRPIEGPWGSVPSANLTPHATGLGDTTREAFIAEFKRHAGTSTAAVPVEQGKNTPMPWLDKAGLTTGDLGAIHDYLRTIPPVANAVPALPHPGAAQRLEK